MDPEYDSNFASQANGVEDQWPNRLTAWLQVGAELEPGGVSVGLAVSGCVPFVAVPGQIAGIGNRNVARHNAAVERWNQKVERPDLRGFGLPSTIVQLAKSTRPA